MMLRPCALYSMGDGSRQRFYPLVGGKKIKIKIYSLAVVGNYGYLSTVFGYFITEILPIGEKNKILFHNVGGKK